MFFVLTIARLIEASVARHPNLTSECSRLVYLAPGYAAPHIAHYRFPFLPQRFSVLRSESRKDRLTIFARPVRGLDTSDPDVLAGVLASGSNWSTPGMSLLNVLRVPQLANLLHIC